ncbi:MULTISPECIES: peptidyl-prolyl cis-trans isomerase [unclassified Algibacter]|uniref:peptidyl-prolyl cis-trans isomerase n=1 Tax=unclassified Algibacter TaxID=2615009 RepID=UPI00131C8352|nr:MULTISPECIES: peptidyl-prolyl cis-trans isomerase [unclassified Algibacter]MCL5129637.1 peptidyl-prolyl cis-trans isomerase [Algibacter sp. L4_22]
MQRIIIFIILASLMVSCDFFRNEEDNRTPIARVNNSYLYEEDVSQLVSEATTKEDSAVLVDNYIKNWATKQLLLDGALLNLSEEKQARFDKLVKQYKTDLYTKAYIEALVNRSIDTVVDRNKAEAYYDLNKDVFKLNEELIKFRYIHVDENIIDYSGIVKRFKRFTETDKKELDSMSIQFKSYSLNDSIWIKVSQVVSKIPAITPENKNQLLKKSNFVQLKDSLGVYLMQINDVLGRNDTAPLEFVTPTINQIVKNKRKLELIKKLEKDITKDAIKNKEFEIYK